MSLSGLLYFSAMASASTFHYPEARKSDQVDDYITEPKWPILITGWKIPIRQKHGPGSTRKTKITFDYLKQIPARNRIKERLTELWNFERFGVPFKQGNRYFLTRNNGLQNQSVLYKLDSLTGEPKVLLDPNKLSADGTVALKGYAITDDGNLLAYGLSAAGSDWEEWRMRDVASGEDTGDLLKWVKFLRKNASWTHDGAGFFYGRYDEPKESEKLQSLNYYKSFSSIRRSTSIGRHPRLSSA